MEKRYWFTSDGMGERRLTRTDPVGDHAATVSARPAEPGIVWDAIWVNGERSYDTYVLIDGRRTYHTPRRNQSTDQSFDLHEAAGSREVLNA